MIGTSLSHYQIIEKLGEGGMGVVYKAHDTHLDRFVAIKVLPPEKVADPERKRRFVQEAKAASALNHPSIITIHDIDQSEGIDFIAMEYVAGKTLDALIPRKGMRLSQTLKCAVQIADALARAHGAGIIHRDLKPSNVMVDEHGLVRVLDFGLAKLGEADGPEGETAATRTGPGTILGTAAYMSPEQAEGKPVDARSDIFSFGSVLYEMLTGERAFRGETTASTIAAILREDPKPISEVTVGLPRELEKIVKRCLRKDPERRFQLMKDVKVELEELKEESDSGALAGEAGVQPAPRRRKWVLVGAAVLVPVVAVLAWILIPTFRRSEPAVKVLPLTTYPGYELYPAFSPDGNQVAFVGNVEEQNNYDIYVEMIGSGGRLRLTRDPAPDGAPSWSPDSRQIAFGRLLSPSRVAVFVVSPLGGPERKVAEWPLFQPPSRFDVDYYGPVWSPDRRWLVVSLRDSPEQPLALFLLSVESGEKRRLTFPSATEEDKAPAFSPDGRTLAFTRYRRGADVGDVYLLELAADLTPKGEPRRLTSSTRVFTRPAWTGDGRGILFSEPGWNRAALWRIGVTDQAEPRRLDFAGEGVFHVAVSSAAHRMAYARMISDMNIWSVETAGASAGQPRKLISSTRVDDSPQFSPDGKKIAFRSSRSGSAEIWICEADGSNPVQLTAFGGHPKWSPDGEQIAFDSMSAGYRHIYVVKATGGKPRALTTNPSQDSVPSWSHDGHWIYFSSNRSGDDQVWKMPASGGEAIQITRNGGSWPFESPDGRTLYYLKRRSGPLFRLPLEGGPESQVLESVYDWAFAVTERGIYFVSQPDENGRALLQLLDFAGGKTREIARLSQPLLHGLAASPDGLTVLFVQSDSGGIDLMLVENFR